MNCIWAPLLLVSFRSVKGTSLLLCVCVCIVLTCSVTVLWARVTKAAGTKGVEGGAAASCIK